MSLLWSAEESTSTLLLPPSPSNQTTLPSPLLVVDTQRASRQQLSRANPTMPNGRDPLFMASARAGLSLFHKLNDLKG